MKKLIMAAIGVLALGVMPAMAQSEDAPARINKVSAFYDLTTLYPKGADNVYFNGFGVGYNIDFRVSRTMPLYVGTGLNARFLFNEKEILDDEVYDLVDVEAHNTFINLNVPLNVSYRVPVADSFYLTRRSALISASSSTRTARLTPTLTASSATWQANFRKEAAA